MKAECLVLNAFGVDGFKCSLKKWRSKENALGMHELKLGLWMKNAGLDCIDRHPLKK